MTEKPKVSSSLAEKELDAAEKQLAAFEGNLKELNKDQFKQMPQLEAEPQTKLSQEEISKSRDIYLKPTRAIGSKEKFNEKFRERYQYDKEYVQFVAENREITGETIDMWTKPYPGMPAEFWNVPVNKPVWGPRYLAEQIKKCKYHRFTMDQKVITSDVGMGQLYGSMIVDTTIQRLDAMPVSRQKSFFMGEKSFA